jgi:hypothetical protein
VTEAISAWLLFAGVRSHGLMPIAQFDPFEGLDKPIKDRGNANAAFKLWETLGDERNG